MEVEEATTENESGVKVVNTTEVDDKIEDLEQNQTKLNSCSSELIKHITRKSVLPTNLFQFALSCPSWPLDKRYLLCVHHVWRELLCEF